MLELGLDQSGTPEVRVRHADPMVYLDHWAVRMFSNDAVLATRFIGALNSRGGTLAVSWINLAEFATMNDPDSVRRAERFFDDVLPRLFFIEPNPFNVIASENEIMARGRAEVPPHMDIPMARELIKLRPETPKPITAIGMLQVIPGSSLVERGQQMADTVIKRFEAIRADCAADPELSRLVRTPMGGASAVSDAIRAARASRDTARRCSRQEAHPQ